MSRYYEPELPTGPPESDYIYADCKHEVYEGEPLYESECKTYCPDCAEDLDLLDCDYEIVTFHRIAS